MANQISTLDSGYIAGDLSLYPTVKDTKASLYEAKNLSITSLRQSLTFNSKFVIVEDTSAFPTNGLLHIGKNPGEAGAGELIYYGRKTTTVFKDLIRGFAGSRQSYWPAGAPVTSLPCLSRQRKPSAQGEVPELHYGRSCAIPMGFRRRYNIG